MVLRSVSRGTPQRRGRVLDPIRTADDAARYLDGLIDRERMPDRARARSRFDLAAIRALLEAVGHPERTLSIVHVAGSKGKGSVCLSAERVLAALGERVGVFTSPHLERWTERFRIGGEEVAGAALARAVEGLRPHVDRLCRDRPASPPSFFDATTAAALMLFAEARVDRVLLEVGLGGRLDATNAVTPRVTCVTQIELEHTQVLGDTLAAIAGEKAGILKAGVPCVVGALAPEAAAVVCARAAEVGAPLFALGEAFDLAVTWPSDRRRGSRLRYRERDGLELEAELPTRARHLAIGAGLALACVRCLREHADADFARAAREGLAALRLPGRVEIACDAPRVVIDSAHTRASAEALAAALGAMGVRSGSARLVLSISRDKALGAILSALLPIAAHVTLTQADPDRSLAARELAAAVRDVAPGLALDVVDDPREAVRAALLGAGTEAEIVIAGSVYLAGIAREVVRASGLPAPADLPDPARPPSTTPPGDRVPST
jgi:dihydrofolate synthase/folylpolyglutamate synthase